MSEKVNKIVENKRKVGRFTIKFIKIPYSSWNIQYLVEVRQGNKIISKSGEYDTRLNGYETYKSNIEEYKLKEIEKGTYKFTRADFVIKPKTADGYIMQRINKYTFEVVDKNCKISTFEGLIRAFIHNKMNKKSVVGNYLIEDDKLIYVDVGNNENKDILVIRLKNKRIIGNASKLKYCGWTRKGDESPAQRVMFNMNVPLVPFNVFEEAELNIQNCEVLEQGKEEDFILPRLEWSNSHSQLEPIRIFFSDTQISKPKPKKYMKIVSMKKENGCAWNRKKDKWVIGWRYRYLDKRNLTKRHFVGAMLIKVKNKFFLFDIDRKEVNNYRFNPFLVELPKPCKTIEQAYDMLKPKEVKQAEKKGLKVLRQGEWFFIPTKKKIREKPKPLPKNIKKGIDNKPTSEEFNLSNICNGALVDKYEIKSMCNRIKPKYRTPLRQRIGDYNKEVSKYLKFVEQKKKHEEEFNFFEYGGDLQAGVNRPNRVSKLFIENKINYVRGEVTHTGREHEPITLKGWYKAVPNTAIKSFTITGNID